MIVLACERKDIVKHWSGVFDSGALLHTVDRWRGLEDYLADNRPELICLHHELPGLGGVRGVHWLQHYYPELKVIVFSDRPADEEGLGVLRNGAQGYINSRAHADVIRQALEVVRLGEIWVGRELMQKMINGLGPAQVHDHVPVASPFASLTPRELEIARHVAEGANNKMIARSMDITERTVKAHLTSIFSKTGLHDRLQLALEMRDTDPDHPMHRTG